MRIETLIILLALGARHYLWTWGSKVADACLSGRAASANGVESLAGVSVFNGIVLVLLVVIIYLYSLFDVV